MKQSLFWKMNSFGCNFKLHPFSYVFNFFASLLQVFETSNISLMADSQYSAQTRVQVLLEFLHEREMDLEDLAEMKRVKLEQCVQLCQFQNDANQVVSWIRNGEAMLTASFTIPNSLQDSEQLKKEHEQFQVAIEVREVAFYFKWIFKVWFNLKKKNFFVRKLTPPQFKSNTALKPLSMLIITIQTALKILRRKLQKDGSS